MHLRWRATLVRTNARHELASLFSRIHQLPRLEAINFTFYPIYGRRIKFADGGRRALQLSILGALAASFRVHVPSRLTSLSLHNLRPSDLSPLESPPFQNFLTTLQRLHLSVLFDSSDPMFETGIRHFWGTIFPRIVLTPMQHTLTELTLHSDSLFGASSGLSLAGLHFPHLCALSLRNLVFEPSIGVESFILQHAATLARLELLACKLLAHPDIPQTPLTPLPPHPSTVLAPDKESRSGPGWDSIWDRFAAELTALVTLHVDEPMCSSYISCCLDLSFWTDYARELRDATDVAALQRFHAIVAARSEEMRGES